MAYENNAVVINVENYLIDDKYCNCSENNVDGDDGSKDVGDVDGDDSCNKIFLILKRVSKPLRSCMLIFFIASSTVYVGSDGDGDK